MKTIRLFLSVVTILMMFILVACNSNEVLENKETIGNNETIENTDEQQELVFDVKEILVNNEWQCDRITDMELNELDMMVEFGSGYLNFPGSLKFNLDGTFTLILPGITTDEVETDGTYVIDKNDIHLTYNDYKSSLATLFIMNPETDSEISVIDYEREYRMYFRIK